MGPDVTELRAFYASPAGQIARARIGAILHARWANVGGLALMGLGFATPYLDALRAGAERSFAFMPAAQGVCAWPESELTLSALVEPERLPLRDSVVDRIVLVHGLEAAPRPSMMLNEAWRVLAPGGRILVVAPARAGALARLSGTPFARGRVFGGAEMAGLLRAAFFTPIWRGHALYLPLVQKGLAGALAATLEGVCASLHWPFAGVHVVEAMKLVYRPALAERAVSREAVAPILVPQGEAG